MLRIPETLPVRTRLPLAAWAVAAVVTLFSLMSALLHASAPAGPARALRLSPPPMNLIARNDELAEACARLGSAPFVAVDTEFMREQTFWPRLCLIPIPADGTGVLIDSL